MGAAALANPIGVGTLLGARDAVSSALDANTPTLPTMDKPAAAPTPGNTQTQADMEAARERERMARGRSATIATGGTGLTTEATTSRRSLLGV